MSKMSNNFIAVIFVPIVKMTSGEIFQRKVICLLHLELETSPCEKIFPCKFPFNFCTYIVACTIPSGLAFSLTHTCFCMFSVPVCLTIYYYFTLCEFSPLVLTGGLSLESEWQQVSSSFQDSSQYSYLSQWCSGLYGIDSSSDFQSLQSSFQAFGDHSKYTNNNWFFLLVNNT